MLIKITHRLNCIDAGTYRRIAVKAFVSSASKHYINACEVIYDWLIVPQSSINTLQTFSITSSINQKHLVTTIIDTFTANALFNVEIDQKIC